MSMSITQSTITGCSNCCPPDGEDVCLPSPSLPYARFYTLVVGGSTEVIEFDSTQQSWLISILPCAGDNPGNMFVNRLVSINGSGYGSNQVVVVGNIGLSPTYGYVIDFSSWSDISTNVLTMVGIPPGGCSPPGTVTLTAIGNQSNVCSGGSERGLSKTLYATISGTGACGCANQVVPLGYARKQIALFSGFADAWIGNAMICGIPFRLSMWWSGTGGGSGNNKCNGTSGGYVLRIESPYREKTRAIGDNDGKYLRGDVFGIPAVVNCYTLPLDVLFSLPAAITDDLCADVISVEVTS